MIKVIKHSPIKGYPFYNRWLIFLLSRELVITKTLTSLDKLKDGQSIGDTIIVPLDRYQETTVTLEGSESFLTCIRCGIRAKALDMDSIRVGALIQFPYSEMKGPNLKIEGYKVRPTSKIGMGCKNCQGDYQEVVREGNSLDKVRLKYGLNLAHMTVLKSKLEEFKMGEAVRCKHGLDMRFCSLCRRANYGSRVARQGMAVPIKVPAPRVPFIEVNLED